MGMRPGSAKSPNPGDLVAARNSRQRTFRSVATPPSSAPAFTIRSRRSVPGGLSSIAHSVRVPRGGDHTGVSIDLERIEVLELLGMTLAHLNDAETRAEVSPRVPLLMAIRDKFAVALREES
jgi:hypothetical protein